MGNNLVLTLDRRIQYTTEKALAQGVAKYNAAGGMAMVIRPQTGEILAMAQLPALDPNQPANFSDEARRNRLLTDCVEPGSTYKIFTVASALDAQVVKAADRYHCENGTYALSAKEVIHDAHPYGALTVQQIIQKSSNIGAAKIANKLGSPKFDYYLRCFGFGRRSGITFPGETAGLLKNLKVLRSAIDRATLAFGQGVSVTMLQMTLALSAMGNDGVMMEPLLVKEVVSPQGQKLQEFQPRPLRRVLSQDSARQMLAIMETVTQEGGTAKNMAPEGFTAAGKTGTAQKIVNRTYSHSKFYAWFIGLVPADKPVLAITVMVDEPKGAYYGGVVAAPIFKEIGGEALRVLGYYPQQDMQKDKNLPVQANADKSKKQDKGKAKAAAPAPAPATIVAAGPVLPLGNLLPKFEAPKEPLKVMPDLRGYTMRQVLDLLHRSGLKCRLEGSGVAVGQDPAPGADIAPGGTCSVKFQSSS
jgi:cell division protein FtsI (penicillin-binding protein 3)